MLESYGLTAQKVLPQVGDMASVMGKDLMQAVEAVADAKNGELERLKEFAISKEQIIAHAEKRLGYMDLVNKQGQITNQEKFNEALFSLMEDNFSGGMERQAGLFNGLMSTIKGVWKSGLSTMSGVTMTGEVIDGSLFHMLKVNAESLSSMLTTMVENGTFIRAGENISKFAKAIGFGLDLAKVGMKTIWPYIRKTGKILSSLVHESIKSIQKMKPVFLKIGSSLNKLKLLFIGGFNKSRIVIQKNLPTLLALKNSIIDLGSKVKSILLKAFELARPPLSWLIDNGLPLLTTVLMGVIETATTLYAYFSEKWITIAPIMEAIGTAISNGMVLAFELMKPIIEFLINDGLPVLTEILLEVVDVGFQVYDFFSRNWSKIEPIVVGISTALLGYKMYLLAVNAATIASAFASGAAAAGMTALGAAIAFITSPVTLVVAAIAGLIAIGYAVIKNWEEVSAFISGVFTSIGDWATGVGDRISSGFTAAYDGVINTWSGIKEWFGSLWEGIVDIGKGYVNIYVKILNWLIEGINKIQFEVPDWVPEIGGKTVGVNIASIPYLADGGVTTGPTLAMIGEGKEQEAVIPLSILSGLFELATMRGNKLAEKNNKRKPAHEVFNSFREKSTSIKSSQTSHVEYKPQIIIEGHADKTVIQRALKEAQDDFDKKMDERERKIQRLSFS